VPEQGGPAIAVGWIELPTARASIKTFRNLSAMHLARFRGRPLDIEEASYQAFLSWVQGHLSGYGISVVLDDDLTPSVRPPAVESRREEATGGDVMTYAAIALLAFLFGASVGGLAVYAKFVGF
jgi:hypothetical protein